MHADGSALGTLPRFLSSIQTKAVSPAHIHVRAGDREAKFWLHDLSVALNAGVFGSRTWRYYPAPEDLPRSTHERME